jgi:hypothetical protein
MSFIFNAFALGVDGQLPDTPVFFAQFRGTPEDALAFFFSKGFQFPYDAQIFTDTTTQKELRKRFEADGYYIPNQMDIALKVGKPNNSPNVNDIRNFTSVILQRLSILNGGRRKSRRQTRRKGTRRYRNRK